MKFTCRYIGRSIDWKRWKVGRSWCDGFIPGNTYDIKISMSHEHDNLFIESGSLYYSYTSFASFIKEWGPIQYISGDMMYPFFIVYKDEEWSSIKDLLIHICRDNKLESIL